MPPKIEEYRKNPSFYPEWVICRLCRGGRGKTVALLDEEAGTIEYKTVPCDLCNGQRLIPAS